MMNDQDKIMYCKNKYKITRFTTYEDLRRSIYNYEMIHFVDLVYSGKDINKHGIRNVSSIAFMVDVVVMLFRLLWKN